MPAAKGTRPPAAGIGRKAGIPNKLTKSAREAFALAFDATGGWTALGQWAQENRSQFYSLYARLIPVEHVGPGGEGPISTIVKHIYEPPQSEKTGG